MMKKPTLTPILIVIVGFLTVCPVVMLVVGSFSQGLGTFGGFTTEQICRRPILIRSLPRSSSTR